MKESANNEQNIKLIIQLANKQARVHTLAHTSRITICPRLAKDPTLFDNARKNTETISLRAQPTF